MDVKFKILGWWKANSNRYQVLSKMARVVLAVPVSIVASELAFSTGRCILDPFRSSLSKDEMEALEDEFHDLGNMFNFQTSCLLNVIKCVIYSSKILSIALIFFFSSFESSNNNSKF